MKVNSFICNKKFPHDAEEFTFKEIVTHLERCKSGIEIWVIGNIELANTQLDILIIKENCLIILDMKNYTGKIIGSENGDWYVESKGGKQIKINDNCFQQARKQRFTLVDKLEDVIINGSLVKFEDNPRVFTYSKAWMYFNEGSTYDYPQSLQPALNWFKVITMDTLCKEVTDADSNAYRFNEDEINELITLFHAERIDIEKENLKQIEEAESGAEIAYHKATLRLKHRRELDELITNLNFIETPESKGIKGRRWKEIKETVYSDTYYFEELKEGEILVIHGDIGIGKTTYMLFFVENILKEGNKEVIFLDSTRIESSLAEVEHDIGKFIVVDALGRGGNIKKKSEQLIDFVKSNKAKLILTMRTHEKDIFEDVVREKGYEIKSVEPKPPLDDVPYIVANYLRYFDVNTDDLDAKEAYEIVFSDDYVYYPELKEALEVIAEKSNGCPFYIYHTISELKRKGLQFDLATVKDLPEGVEELLINTLRNDFVFKEKGREGNKSFLKLLICLSKIEKDFSTYLYESLYEELRDESNVRDRVDAFKLFLSEGESVYEFILPSYWKEAIQKALRRDAKDKWLADEFIRAEAELEPKIIETVLKREIEKKGINRRYFHLIADAAKAGLLDYAYEKYKETGKNENEGKDYAKFVIFGEYCLRGIPFIFSKQYEKAIKDLNKAIELNPEYAIAYTFCGKAYTKLKQHEDAFRNYTKAIELKPESALAYRYRGGAYLEREDFEKALQDFDKVTELKPEDAEAYILRGSAYAGLMHLEEAIKDFNEAIELNPENVHAYVSRGNVYGILKDYDKAIKDFDEAMELNPENAHAYRFRGDVYARLELFEEAIRDYTTAIEFNPIYVDAYSSRSDAYSILGHYEEAIKDLDKAIELSPGNTMAYVYRGGAYMELGHFEEALKDFDKVIELKPEDADAYRFRGAAYIILDNYNKALKDFDKAIELNPEATDAYSSRGDVYAKLGNGEKAIREYNKAIELNPEDVDAYSSRGDVYAKLGNCEKAIRDYNKTIELNPEDAHAYFSRGLIHRELEHYKKALKDFDEAIELSPENVHFYMYRGFAYDELQHYEEAIRDYTKAIELSPENAIAYSSRGDVYAKLEQYEEALKDLDKAIELNPEATDAYISRGIAYAELEHYEEALKDFDKAVELSPGDADAYCSRGEAYDELEQYEEAISDYTKAIKLSPKNARAYLSRGIVYAKLEQYEEALKDLDKAIELNPENADAYRYRGNAYVDLEQYEAAISDYTKAIELNPENAIVYRLRSLAYAKLGDNGAARQDLDMVVELNRDTEV